MFVNVRIMRIIIMLCAFCFFCALLISFNVQAQSVDLQNKLQPRMAISPPRIDLELNESGLAEGDFTVLNFGSKPMAIELSLVHWDLDENSQVRVIDSTEQSLDQWLVVNPLRFVVNPNDSQTVRFGVRPRVAPEPGEHRAMVYISDVSQREKGVPLAVNYRYGLPIYGHVGKKIIKPNVHGITVEPSDKISNGHDIIVDWENLGTAHVKPIAHIGLWSQSQFPGADAAIQYLEQYKKDKDVEVVGVVQPEKYIPLFSNPVFPGLRKPQRTALEDANLDPGIYHIVVFGHIGPVELKESFTLVKEP